MAVAAVEAFDLGAPDVVVEAAFDVDAQQAPAGEHASEHAYSVMAPYALVSMKLPPGTRIEATNEGKHNMVRETASVIRSTYAPYDWDANFARLVGRVDAVEGYLGEKAYNIDDPVKVLHGGLQFAPGSSVGIYRADVAADPQVYAVAFVQMPLRLFRAWAQFAVAQYREEADTENRNAAPADSENMRLTKSFADKIFVQRMRRDLPRLFLDSGIFYIQAMLFAFNLCKNPTAFVHNPYNRDTGLHQFVFTSDYMAGYMSRQDPPAGNALAEGTQNVLLLKGDPVQGLYLAKTKKDTVLLSKKEEGSTAFITTKQDYIFCVAPEKTEPPALSFPWKPLVHARHASAPRGDLVALIPDACVYCLHETRS